MTAPSSWTVIRCYRKSARVVYEGPDEEVARIKYRFIARKLRDGSVHLKCNEWTIDCARGGYMRTRW